jgi:hypothetical protein
MNKLELCVEYEAQGIRKEQVWSNFKFLTVGVVKVGQHGLTVTKFENPTSLVSYGSSGVFLGSSK